MGRSGSVLRGLFLLSPTVLLAAAAVWFVAGQFDDDPPAESSLAGKLVVLVVFDQMRGDLPDRYAPLFGKAGFERMKADGVWFSDCHVPYAGTSTGPGHASISTGVPPSIHGIVENEWYDRNSGLKVRCSSAARPYDRVPGDGSRATSGGLSPERLLAPTVGDALTADGGPKGKVVSLALKDRAAVLLGGKSPTAAYCFDTATGQFHTSAYYRDAAHAWAVAFNKTNAADRWVGKTWDRLGDTAAYDKLAGPDDAPGEGDGYYGQGRTFPHPFGRGTSADGKYYTALECSPMGNELLWEFAKAAIAGESLGTKGTPDLLCLGFSANDVVGHMWGPDSHEVCDTTARADKLLADIFAHLDEAVGKGRWTVIVTADHGVCPLPESKSATPGAERFHPGDLAPLDEVLDEKYGKPETGKWVERVEYPWVYLSRKAADSVGVPLAEVTNAAAQWAGHRSFTATAFTRAQLAGPPAADPLLRAAQLGYHPDRCGDVYVVPRMYCLPLGKGSTGTSHGSPHPYDTHVPLFAVGAGIPPAKKRTDRVSSLTVAPLVCHALGVPPPTGLAEKLPDSISK